jgi:hypothetical protein
MEPATLRIGTRGRKLAPFITALTVAAAIGWASTEPAHAQDYDQNGGRNVHRDHNSRDHNYRPQDRHRDRNRYESRSYERPAYVYSPPPVYYAPPPPPPAIDFVFPLRFR